MLLVACFSKPQLCSSLTSGPCSRIPLSHPPCCCHPTSRLAAGDGADLEGEGGRPSEDSEAQAAREQLPQSSFTERSRAVLAEYRRRLLPSTGSKRRHPSQGGLAATQLSLDALVAGKSRGEACRWVGLGGGWAGLWWLPWPQACYGLSLCILAGTRHYNRVLALQVSLFQAPGQFESLGMSRLWPNG